MVNITEFISRLNIIMDYYQLSSSSFADKIKVQRSSISHLLSGRNKPSLDFVLKVVQEFKEVELYWLLNGKGFFPNESVTPPIEVKSNYKNQRDRSNVISIEKTELSINSKNIERIVLFYSDGTFKEYIQ